MRLVDVDPEDCEQADLAEAVLRVAGEVGIRFMSDEEVALAAVDDGEVVGGAAVSSHRGGLERCFSVVVSPYSQGRGVGRALIARVVRDARDAEVETIYGFVVNDRLRPHLRSLGFEEDGRWMVKRL